MDEVTNHEHTFSHILPQRYAIYASGMDGKTDIPMERETPVDDNLRQPGL